MKVTGKRILIYGMSRTGLALLEFLKKRQAIIYLYDDNQDVSKYIDNKIILPFSEFLIDASLLDLIIVSPGVSLETKLLKMAKLNKINVIGEVEFAFNFCKSKKMIAITGTNGKTTTTELISQVLSQKYKVHKCGNIGIPFISVVDSIEVQDYVVLEISSFQLETIKKFRPKISVILNLKPDHLDRYEDLNDYYKSKLKIYKNQKRKDICILNKDDENINKLVKTIHCKAKKIYFSKCNYNVNGFIRDKSIILKMGKNEQLISYLENLKLQGEHNYLNILATVLVGIIENVDIDNVRNVIENFNSLEHRQEFVKNVDGVEYVNDSKATNIDATINALTAYKNKRVHLLLGGSDKGEEFENFFKSLSNNVKCYIFGETREKMKWSAINVGYFNFVVLNKLCDALNDAKKNAKASEIVLLSPACASFDEFSNFEERGKYFKEWVSKC